MRLRTGVVGVAIAVVGGDQALTRVGPPLATGSSPERLGRAVDNRAFRAPQNDRIVRQRGRRVGERERLPSSGQPGQIQACRRLTRSIFLGSVPGKAHAGLDVGRIYLGVAQPKEGVSVYGDALRTLSGRLSYLYGTDNM